MYSLSQSTMLTLPCFTMHKHMLPFTIVHPWASSPLSSTNHFSMKLGANCHCILFPQWLAAVLRDVYEHVPKYMYLLLNFHGRNLTRSLPVQQIHHAHALQPCISIILRQVNTDIFCLPINYVGIRMFHCAQNHITI